MKLMIAKITNSHFQFNLRKVEFVYKGLVFKVHICTVTVSKECLA